MKRVPYFYTRLFPALFTLLCSLGAGAQSRPDPAIDTLIRAIPPMMRRDEAIARGMIEQLGQRSAVAQHRHGQAQASLFRAWVDYRHQPPDTAIRKLDSALRHFTAAELDSIHYKMYVLKGQCYVKKADYNGALARFDTALRITRAHKDHDGITSTLISIGWAYLESAKPEEANRFFMEALSLNPSPDFPHRAVLLCNIASGYNTSGDFRKAEAFAKEGIAAARRFDSQLDLGNGLHILGRSYYMQGRVQEAITVLTQAAATRAHVSDPSLLASDYLELADLYEKTGQPLKAVAWAKKSEALSMQSDNALKLNATYQVLASAYEAAGNHKEALRYLHKVLEQADSSKADNDAKALAAMQVQFDTEKRKAENLRLTHENLVGKLRNSKQQRWLLVLGGLILLLGVTAVYWSVLLKSRYRTTLALKQLAEQRQRMLAVIEAEENERSRIAGELHDSVAQTLAAAAMQLEKAQQNQAPLSKVDHLLQQAGTEIRSLSHRMTPELLLHGGLPHALELAVAQINDAQDGLQCTLFTNLTKTPAADGRALALYRCFQELSHNVLRHAGATRLDVQLNCDDTELQLVMEDNGKGFDTATVSGGLGLHNLRSRLEAYGGRLLIDSTPGHGTTVVAQFESAAEAPHTPTTATAWNG